MLWYENCVKTVFIDLILFFTSLITGGGAYYGSYGGSYYG